MKNSHIDPETYIRQARKLENSKSIFEFVFKDLTSDRYEQIANLYEKAGNIYKIKDKEKAIDCYKIANNYLLDIKEGTQEYYEHEIKQNLLNIAELYVQIDYTKSIEMYHKIINHFMIKGDVSSIIKYYEIIANLYWDNGYLKESKEIYENTKSMCNSHNVCPDIKKKVGERLAEIHIKTSDLIGHLKASELYFEIADEYLKTKLGTYSAKKYIFNGTLAVLAFGDLVKATQEFDRFVVIDHTFKNSQEGQFISKLLEIINSSDFEGFTSLCEIRDKTNPLDSIQVELLLKIKKQLANGLDGLDGLDELDRLNGLEHDPDEPDLS